MDKEDYIPRCPHCNDNITELDAFVLEENKYTVELHAKSSSLDWSTSDVVESTAIRTVYNCPNCEETLFTVRSGDSDPRTVIDFLKGVRMTWVQDVGIRAMVLDTFNKREPRPRDPTMRRAIPGREAMSESTSSTPPHLSGAWLPWRRRSRCRCSVRRRDAAPSKRIIPHRE